MRKRVLAAVVPAATVVWALSASVPQAASPDAWARHEAEVAKTCAAASELAKTKTWRQPAEFELHAVTLVRGEIASGAMKGRPVRMLCLFDKHTRKATVSEVPQGADW